MCSTRRSHRTKKKEATLRGGKREERKYTWRGEVGRRGLIELAAHRWVGRGFFLLPSSPPPPPIRDAIQAAVI